MKGIIHNMHILGLFLINIVFVRMEYKYCCGPLIIRQRNRRLNKLVSLITPHLSGVTHVVPH